MQQISHSKDNKILLLDICYLGVKIPKVAECIALGVNAPKVPVT